MNPNCAVRNPITQKITLLRAATTSPAHSFRPTKIVESTVRVHET